MLNSKRMFRELNKLLPTLKDKYGDKIVGIGVRYSDKTVDKAESAFPNLLPTLWSIVDSKHAVSERHRNVDVEGIFICDSMGRTIYDSVSYRPDKQKIKLMRDGDRRVLFYKSMPLEDREAIVEKVAKTIEDEINKENFLKDKTQESSPWGDMPWDFK